MGPPVLTSVLLYSLASFIGEIVGEGEKTVPNVRGLPAKWLAGGQVCTESQGSDWGTGGHRGS